MKAIFEAIEEDLLKITDRQIEQSLSFADGPQEGDEALWTIQSDRAKRLWALAFSYTRLAQMTGHAAIFDSESEEQKKDLIAKARRYGHLEDIVRSLAWIEIRDEAAENSNSSRPWAEESVALRKGYIVVIPKEDRKEAGPSIEIPEEVRQAMRRTVLKLFGNMGEQPEETPVHQKRRKPQ